MTVITIPLTLPSFIDRLHVFMQTIESIISVPSWFSTIANLIFLLSAITVGLILVDKFVRKVWIPVSNAVKGWPRRMVRWVYGWFPRFASALGDRFAKLLFDVASLVRIWSHSLRPKVKRQSKNDLRQADLGATMQEDVGLASSANQGS